MIYIIRPVYFLIALKYTKKSNFANWEMKYPISCTEKAISYLLLWDVVNVLLFISFRNH